MRFLLNILAFLLPAAVLSGQGVVSADEAVRAALQNHPAARAAALDVQARTYAEKAAFNLPNPELIAESPTGEFYVLGVEQSFAFPTVYARQKQLARAETTLARTAQQVADNELRYTVRSLYLEAQVAAYELRQWTERDSLYRLILAAANRQHAAGEIDFLQKTLVENETGNLRLSKDLAELKAAQLRLELQLVTGLAPPLQLPPLAPDTLNFSRLYAVDSHPAVVYERQAAQVAERQVAVARSRALPDFSIGYMNQGERDSPLGNRFNASIGLPLWAGQYRAGIKTARAESQAAAARAEAQGLAVSLELERLRLNAAVARVQLRYFESEALPRSRSLIATATRLREAGQTDYVTFLRTLDAAFAIPRDYAAQVQAFEAARIRMLYLAGQ